MNSFNELASCRRSVRKFTDELLTAPQVETILRAALMSPTSKNLSSWEFVVVEEKEQLKALSLCKKNFAGFIADSALSVIVLGDRQKSDAWVEDCSIAAITMQLQAEDLGLGSCWVQVRERMTEAATPSEEYVRSLFGIPEQMGVLAVIAIGHKMKESKPFDESRLQWEKMHLGKW